MAAIKNYLIGKVRNLTFSSAWSSFARYPLANNREFSILSYSRDNQAELNQKVGTKGIFLIGHVRYINILTWLRGFQVKRLYLVLFSLYQSLFLGIEGQKKLKKIVILT